MTTKTLSGYGAFVVQAAKSFLRPPGFSVPAFLCFFLAVAVSTAVLGYLYLESVIPLKVSSTLAVDPVPPVDLGFVRSDRASTPSSFQAEALGRFLLVLGAIGMAAVSVAALNLSILLRTRSASRAHERAIRLAVGASRKQLALEWLIGAGALFGVAGVAGVLAGRFGRNAMASTWPHLLARVQDGSLQNLAIPVLGLLLFWVLAASYSVPPDPSKSGSSRGVLNGGARLVGARHPEGIRLYAPALQIGLSLTLISGSACLLEGSFSTPDSSDVAVEASGVLRTPLALGSVGDPARRDPDAWEEAISRVKDLPETAEVALVTPGTLVGVGTTDLAWTECGACSIGGMWVPFQAPSVQHHAVSPDSFRILGASMTQGREFTASDSPDGTLVAIVNATYARKYFDEDGPLGKTIGLGRGQKSWHTVVGVVEDFGVPGIGSGRAPRATVYLSTRQHPPDLAELLVVPTAHNTVDPDAVADAVKGVDGLALHGEASRLGDYLKGAVSPVGWFGRISSFLGVGTFIIAVLGLYSILEYSVSTRTQEFAVRRSMGAGPWRILRLVLWRSARIILLGLFLGLEGSLFLASGFQGVVSGSTGFDPVFFFGACTGFLVLGLLGSIQPARRASAISPRVAMGGM